MFKKAASSLLQHYTKSSKSISTSGARQFSSSKPVLATFTVQDETEYKENVLGSTIPIVVDFSADAARFRLDEAIAATEGAVDLAIVDIDDLADIALEHGVNAVPTLLGIKDGQVVEKFVELKDEDKLEAFVTRLQSQIAVLSI